MQNPLRPMPDAPAQPPDSAPADRDWFGGRRWTGIGALAVLVAVALCLVLVLVIGGGKHAASHTPTISATGTLTNSSPAPDISTAVPTAAPEGTRWTIYETVALPSIAGLGPTHVEGAIATGYAHTPTGALLAVANESYRYLLASDAEFRAAAAAMCAPGPGLDAWYSNRGSHPYGDQGGSSTSLAQIAGFQFVSYSATDAVIQLATRDSHGVYQVGADHVQWVDGDWRLVLLTPYGSDIANKQTLSNLAGFNEWRGV